MATAWCPAYAQDIRARGLALQANSCSFCSQTPSGRYLEQNLPYIIQCSGVGFLPRLLTTCGPASGPPAVPKTSVTLPLILEMETQAPKELWPGHKESQDCCGTSQA